MTRPLWTAGISCWVAFACADDRPTLGDVENVGRTRQNLTFVDSSGLVSMEAENYTAVASAGSKSWSPVTTSSPSAGTALAALPDTGTANNTGYTTSSPRVDFQVTFSQAGTYQVWVRGRAGGSSAADSDSVHVGLDGAALSSADRITSFGSSFGWSRSTMDNVNATINVPSAGVHTVNVWMREDGFVFDKLVLAESTSYVPSGTGPTETVDSGPPPACSPATYEAENMSSTTGGSTTGGWNIWSNGSISTSHTFQAGAATLTVRAQGTQAVGVWPSMVVRVGSTQVGQVSVASTSWTDYTFPLTATSGSQTISVEFTNDYYDSAAGADRNLLVDRVVVGCPSGGCGNGTCDASEDCDSCASDCGACPVCTDDDVQPGSTSCGLNGRGVYEQLCVTGQWQNTATCLDDDECTDDDVQEGTAPCGINGRGVYDWVCTTGAWQQSTTCNDPDECTDDDARAGTTSCGLNGRGDLEQVCETGTWVDTSTCVDTDVCVDGSTQDGTTACGFNGRGTLVETCVTGQWQESATCNDPDSCVDGSTQTGSTACGLNGRGALQQQCTAGSWVDTSTCVDPDQCTDDDTQSGGPCGLNGRGTTDQLCIAGGWQDVACQDPDECTDDDEQVGTTPCDEGGTLEQLCVEGQWEDTTTCNNPIEATSVWIEAELGSLSGSPSFDVVSDAGAAGGAYIAPTNTSTSSPGPNRADYAFSVQAGTYVLWVRATAPSASSDSLWVSIDGGSFVKWNNVPNAGGYGWDDAHDSDAGDSPVTFALSDGAHTLTVANRESGIQIDKFYLTADGDTPSGEGDVHFTCSDGAQNYDEEDVDCGGSCPACPVCTDDGVQPGTTSCGFNGRGVYEQLCVDGQWENQPLCLDPDECVDGATQSSGVPCGNGGTFDDVCTDGLWVETTNCNEPASATSVWIEAESGTLTGNPSFNVASDGAASGGAYLASTSTNTGSPGPNRAAYSFTVQAGTYVLWMRANAPSADDDSLWFSVDGGSFIKWNNVPNTGGYGWDDGHNSDSGDARVTFALAAGTHTLTIANREDGVRIDKFYVTSDGDTPSGVGGPYACGNSVCDANETCNSCQADCGACPTEEWLPSWATSIQRTETSNLPPALGNNTLRQFVWPTYSGNQIRLQLSNEKGNGSVQVNSVAVAKATSGSGITASTSTQLRFSGNTNVTIPAGATVWSDPVSFPLVAMERTAISIHFTSVPSAITGHPGSRMTSYVSSGNVVAQANMSGAQTRDRWYFINAIEVMAPADAFAVSVLGDSITDGYGVLNSFQRWTDYLTQRIKNDSTIANKVSVLNAGMGANSLLSGNGDQDSGLVRFQRDVLGRPKVKWLILLHGVNDIGGQSNFGLVNQVTGAYQQIIDQAHAAGILVYGSPITPFKGHSYAGGQALSIRNQINTWVRNTGGFDAVIDLANAVANPSDPDQLRSSYSNDWLHPNTSGYQAMGNAVNLSLFYSYATGPIQ